MDILDERPAVAKGRRPYFFDDPSVDKLVSIVISLAGEVSVLRERLDTHERLAEEKTWASGSNIESFVIGDELRQVRGEQRAAFLKRVLRVLSDELERMQRDDKEKSYPQPADLDS